MIKNYLKWKMAQWKPMLSILYILAAQPFCKNESLPSWWLLNDSHNYALWENTLYHSQVFPSFFVLKVEILDYDSGGAVEQPPAGKGVEKNMKTGKMWRIEWTYCVKYS